MREVDGRQLQTQSAITLIDAPSPRAYE